MHGISRKIFIVRTHFCPLSFTAFLSSFDSVTVRQSVKFVVGGSVPGGLCPSSFQFLKRMKRATFWFCASLYWLFCQYYSYNFPSLGLCCLPVFKLLLLMVLEVWWSENMLYSSWSLDVGTCFAEVWARKWKTSAALDFPSWLCQFLTHFLLISLERVSLWYWDSWLCVLEDLLWSVRKGEFDFRMAYLNLCKQVSSSEWSDSVLEDLHSSVKNGEWHI